MEGVWWEGVRKCHCSDMTSHHILQSITVPEQEGPSTRGQDKQREKRAVIQRTRSWSHNCSVCLCFFVSSDFSCCSFSVCRSEICSRKAPRQEGMRDGGICSISRRWIYATTPTLPVVRNRQIASVELGGGQQTRRHLEMIRTLQVMVAGSEEG